MTGEILEFSMLISSFTIVCWVRKTIKVKTQSYDENKTNSNYDNQNEQVSL